MTSSSPNSVWRVREKLGRPDLTILGLASLALVGATGAGIYWPWLIAASFGVLPMAALVRSPVGRLGVYVVGGLLSLGGESGLGVVKLIYALTAMVLAMVAFRRLKSMTDPRPVQLRGLAYAMSGTLTLLLGLGVLVGLMNGHSLLLILQDSFTYALLAIAPLIGLDAASEGEVAGFKVLVIVAAVVAAAGWLVFWLARRGSSVAGLEHVALVTSFLAIACFGIALAISVAPPLRWGSLFWGSIALLLPVVYVVSGSRSMSVFALGLLGVLGATRFGRLSPGRWALIVGAVIAVMFVAFTSALGFLENPEQIVKRFDRTWALLDSGSLTADGSYVDRSRAYGITLAVFQESFIIGRGFGHVYPSVNGASLGDFKVDTPVLLLAKFGVVGGGLLVYLIYLLWVYMRVVKGPGQLRLAETAFRIFVLVGIGRLWFVAPPEDKGFAFALSLLVCFGALAPQLRMGGGPALPNALRVRRVRVLQADPAPPMGLRVASGDSREFKRHISVCRSPGTVVSQSMRQG